MTFEDSHPLAGSPSAAGSREPAKPRILVVTAVEAERDAVLRGIAGAPGGSPAAAFDAIAAGVGPASAAASTALALARAAATYDLVVSAGIGGGFVGQAEIGSLVLSDRIVSADLGAETPEAPGFLSVDELGFGSARVDANHAWNERLLAALLRAGLGAIHAPVITVSSATGTAATAALRAELVPGAASEGMEGFGVATAAAQLGIPVTELRAISNAVGPRDRAAWRIGEALQALEAAFRAIAVHIK
ncbi:futalosine hydrolase [Paenibacillus soyae]|uniref:Futalosine hydrolase n=1 Tax=Paenibacillus soyae TaxID=2969249 RepID=A0A9X2MX30_9BACL|nr:futalosine hydrolase [Paenibacillus soyae]MCR2805182.1 futalosine hydrolase [Paenibacillus soyae]